MENKTKYIKQDYASLVKLRVSKYANVSKRDIKNEYVRLCDLLHELRQDEANNSEYINIVLDNIKILESKKHYNSKEKTIVTIDKVFKWALWSFMVVYCLSLFVLPIWMIFTSMKTPLELVENQFGLPQSLNFKNYKSVFNKLVIKLEDGTQYNMLDMAGISLIYSFGSSFLSVSLTTMVAYVLAKYSFPGRNTIYTIGIIVMIVPIVGAGPSAMLIKQALHIYDNMLLFILTGPACVFSGLNFLLLYGNFKSLPWDYAEAVFVDGGGHYSAFFKMYLPMAVPTMAVIFILGFLGTWNDYSTFMIWLPSTPNLAFGLYKFQNISRALYKSSITEIMAGFSIVIIPTVALYLSSQKLILSKFTVGGLKG